jgi:hypothetical protein
MGAERSDCFDRASIEPSNSRINRFKCDSFYNPAPFAPAGVLLAWVSRATGQPGGNLTLKMVNGPARGRSFLNATSLR